MKSKMLRVFAVALLAWPLAATANVLLQYGGTALTGPDPTAEITPALARSLVATHTVDFS